MQVKSNTPNFTSQETKDLIQRRDTALATLKTTGDQGDMRNYKTLRNLVHKKIKNYKNEDIKRRLTEAQNNTNDKKLWITTKQIIGWNTKNAPKLLVHQNKTITNTLEIANTINREQILRNIRLRREVPRTPTDPMTNYNKATRHIKNKFEIKQINMHQLRNTLSKIKPSGSTGVDSISTRTLKNLNKALEAPILNLVNLIITQNIYPDNLKLAKAVPLLKQGKLTTDPLSYRAVNLLPALSKIVDRVIAEQFTKFLSDNDAIPYQHHGGIKSKSTVTAIMTLIDQWTEAIENGEKTAVIIIDQSAAYDTIDHTLLLMKLKAVGCTDNSLKYFKHYLENRRQLIHMEGINSNELHIGNMSVIQGSTLSCLLYMVYTLDLPLLFNENKINVEQSINDDNPKSTTYVDDTTTSIKLLNDTNYQTQIDNTVNTLSDYMNSNYLTMNKTKTQLVILAKDTQLKHQLQINTPTKIIKHTTTFKYLGITINDDMKWNQHIIKSKESLVKQMHTRLNSIKMLKKHLDINTLKKIGTGLIYSKMLYAIEVWGAAPKYLIKQVHNTLMKTARLLVGNKCMRWSNTKTLQELNWLSTDQQITLTTAKVGHKIMYMKIPEVISHKIHRDRTEIITRQSGPHKFGPRPRHYGGGTYTKHQMRTNLYLQYEKIPEQIQVMKDPTKFKQWTKKYLLNPGIKLPQIKK